MNRKTFFKTAIASVFAWCGIKKKEDASDSKLVSVTFLHPDNELKVVKHEGWHKFSS